MQPSRELEGAKLPVSREERLPASKRHVIITMRSRIAIAFLEIDSARSARKGDKWPPSQELAQVSIGWPRQERANVY